LIARNPLQRLRKPAKASRGTNAFISAEDHATLCEHADPFSFASLRLLWLTGARPGEVAGLEAGDVDLTQGVAVLTEHKTAHLGKCRIVFLCPEAVNVLRERIAERPQGLLFPGVDKVSTSGAMVVRRLTWASGLVVAYRGSMVSESEVLFGHRA
jgi:integrase